MQQCCCCSVTKSCLTLQPNGLQHARIPCPSRSLSLFKLMPIALVMSSNHLILCHLLLLPSIFPSIRANSSESAFCIRWPKYWSFSINPSVNNQGWFSLGLTDLVSLLSQESSPAPQFKSINSSMLSLLYGPTLKSVHYYWENHSFDYTDLCWQNVVSAF